MKRARRALARGLEFSHEQLAVRASCASPPGGALAARFVKLHVDETTSLVREYEQLVRERDLAVKYLRQVWGLTGHVYFPDDRREIVLFLARFSDGDCPAHEDGCLAMLDGIPLVGCPACEHKNGEPL